MRDDSTLTPGVPGGTDPEAVSDGLVWMKRWIAGAFAALLFLALFLSLFRFYANRFERTTGDAAWIWVEHRLSSREPVVFFATRTFEIPARRDYVRVRVAGDPSYTLFLNGEEIGGRGAGQVDAIDVWDVSSDVREGLNSIVVAVRSPEGVGGLLVAVDLGPTRENWIVTDRSWRVTHRWSRSFEDTVPPVILGRPPFGRWNYLPEVRRERVAREDARPAIAVEERDAALPEIRVSSGVAVATSRPARVRLFDFGPTRGAIRVRHELDRQELVQIRYLSEIEEIETFGPLQSVVMAAGEESVTVPVDQPFRWVAVYDSDAIVEALPESASP